MKKLIAVLFAVVFFIACTEEKTKKEKVVEKSIEEVEAINSTIDKTTKELEGVVKEVESVVKEVEDIFNELGKL